MDRDRAGAWAASLGDHPHASAVRSILALFDSVSAHRDLLLGSMAAAVEARQAAEVRARVLAEDAARLAGWIIAHPSGSDPTEVLTLHDRAVG